ncbi:hypothetical protein BU26DRAFT_575716 [Trematosphaeria pertusa]|uniref:Uncharacterized protein n=1 Tax=Trematosphaeria pertusa TaxID=390896 RepID=A0A6A6J5M8_9PLEO|nr:uncharacterized protein BU26DRAFT_575716 [Trematosphaeria pertusa]KAF2257190.1 hypothetical protein BU26DRAFT_575716 [Trematosphaeria pertusa]
MLAGSEAPSTPQPTQPANPPHACAGEMCSIAHCYAVGAQSLSPPALPVHARLCPSQSDRYTQQGAPSPVILRLCVFSVASVCKYDISPRPSHLSPGRERPDSGATRPIPCPPQLRHPLRAAAILERAFVYMLASLPCLHTSLASSNRPSREPALSSTITRLHPAPSSVGPLRSCSHTRPQRPRRALATGLRTLPERPSS